MNTSQIVLTAHDELELRPCDVPDPPPLCPHLFLSPIKIRQDSMRAVYDSIRPTKQSDIRRGWAMFVHQTSDKIEQKQLCLPNCREIVLPCEILPPFGVTEQLRSPRQAFSCSTTYFRQNIGAPNRICSSNRHNVKFNNSKRISKQWRNWQKMKKIHWFVERVHFHRQLMRTWGALWPLVCWRMAQGESTAHEKHFACKQWPSLLLYVMVFAETGRHQRTVWVWLKMWKRLLTNRRLTKTECIDRDFKELLLDGLFCLDLPFDFRIQWTQLLESFPCQTFTFSSNFPSQADG